MQKELKTRGLAAVMVLAIMFASLGIATSAQAKLVEPFQKFQYCPWHDPEVAKCLYSLTEDGEVVLGSKKVPIVNPVVLQGGYSEQDPVTKFSKFFAATNGVTLSKASQPVPGGLAGFVNCKEISSLIFKATCELTFENGLTGVDSTLELAKPASEIVVSDANLARREGVALKMPVKAHLENPLLGEDCYVGSSGSPIWWELTSYITSPNPPNTPIEGASGEVEFLEEGLILKLKGNKLVDNNWSAPGASGCGGVFAFILDPLLDTASGLPAASGANTAILNNTIEATTPFALQFNEEQNP